MELRAVPACIAVGIYYILLPNLIKFEIAHFCQIPVSHQVMYDYSQVYHLQAFKSGRVTATPVNSFLPERLKCVQKGCQLIQSPNCCGQGFRSAEIDQIDNDRRIRTQRIWHESAKGSECSQEIHGVRHKRSQKLETVSARGSDLGPQGQQNETQRPADRATNHERSSSDFGTMPQ